MDDHSDMMLPAENVQYLIRQLKKKFSDKTLRLKDFEIDVKELGKKEFITEENQNIYDEYEMDFELDFENGQIKMTSPTCKESELNPFSQKNVVTKEELAFRDKMHLLMTTFENETRRLDRKLERERQLIQKRCEMKFDSDLQCKEEDYNRTVKQLKVKIEDMEKEQDDVLAVHEQEKRDIEQFYLKQIEEERERLKLGMQKKIIQAKSQEWKKTKV